ncbi:WD40 repeat domain-containing protein [Streptomyces sp. NPDC006645]|uniref:WD40 repeat domain-containing protein n=1 Tax=unclassified Streptomyces TaxID=2593676 RepID=UPI0033A2048D
MTDLYAVRVLAIDPADRRIRLRVTVLYYDIGGHQPLPDDASFYLRLLKGGPLGDAITREQYADEAWVDANTRWYVAGLERIVTRNQPFTGEVEERLSESLEGAGGGFPWEDGRKFHEMPPESAERLERGESVRVGADYDVVVTDSRWIEHLEVGDWWRTTSYPTCADRLFAGEAGAVPDLRSPVAVLKTFGRGEKHGQLEFSDDSRFLAVTGEHGELVVYDTADWHECLRTRHGDDFLSPWLMWVPGEPVITVRDQEESGRQFAYDAISGAPVEAPPQTGHTRSPTGRYRTAYAPGPAVALLSGTGGRRVVSVGEAAGKGAVDSYEGVAFRADESRMFVARGARVYVMDPVDGRTLDVIENDGVPVQSLRVSPAGDYLAITGKRVHDMTIRRVGDHRIVTRDSIGSRRYPLWGVQTTWSPDGRRLAAALTTLARDGRVTGGEVHVFPLGLPGEPVTS